MELHVFQPAPVCSERCWHWSKLGNSRILYEVLKSLVSLELYCEGSSDIISSRGIKSKTENALTATWLAGSESNGSATNYNFLAWSSLPSSDSWCREEIHPDVQLQRNSGEKNRWTVSVRLDTAGKISDQLWFYGLGDNDHPTLSCLQLPHTDTQPCSVQWWGAKLAPQRTRRRADGQLHSFYSSEEIWGKKLLRWPPQLSVSHTGPLTECWIKMGWKEEKGNESTVKSKCVCVFEEIGRNEYMRQGTRTKKMFRAERECVRVTDWDSVIKLQN